MSGHTKKLRIKPKGHAKVLTKPAKKGNIPWRETAKESIEKYTEAGVMLRGARFKAELTQKQLAEKLGIFTHHVSEMEHGKRTIGKAMAKRLAEVLNVDYRVFL